MKDKDSILLPGLDQQIYFLRQNLDLSNFNILIVGSGSAMIAKSLINNNNRVGLIVDDYESMITTNFELKDHKNILLRLMDYENTDFTDDEFDIIYAQG